MKDPASAIKKASKSTDDIIPLKQTLEKQKILKPTIFYKSVIILIQI